MSTHTAAPQLAVPVSGSDHAQGPANAPVTLVEYGDYECPYCGQAYPIVKSLQQQFGDQLRFVFRNFPLQDIHPYALHAAEAAEAVGRLGGNGDFWKMHDTLYTHQNALDDAHLAQYAKSAGVDGAAVMHAVDDNAEEARVQADFSGGVRSGVNGTPTFFINGARFDGDWTDASAFGAALQEAAG